MFYTSILTFCVKQEELCTMNEGSRKLLFSFEVYVLHYLICIRWYANSHISARWRDVGSGQGLGRELCQNVSDALRSYTATSFGQEILGWHAKSSGVPYPYHDLSLEKVPDPHKFSIWPDRRPCQPPVLTQVAVFQPFFFPPHFHFP
jgi:hypothetical protein